MKKFVNLTVFEGVSINWPSENHFLRSAPEKFFARTRVNPDYGKPGWSRDCGKRFHRGCDIASVRFTPRDQKVTVRFSNCETGEEFESEEPAFVPHDDIFAVFDGVVDEVVEHEAASDFGLHVVLCHEWPKRDEVFYTLYGHLSDLQVEKGERIGSGQKIGTMGTTSRIPDAKNWMSIAPHLHFEVWDENRRAYDPEFFLRAFLPK